MKNILLGLTGSVATLKANRLISELWQFGEVKIIATKSAQYFLNQMTFNEKPSFIYRDEDEWPQNYKLGDDILHIELRKWASCLVIAPLDANTLAKLEHGLCDNLLTSVYRAWDHCRPVIVAPAMNTLMWENEPTALQIDNLKKRGTIVIPPVSKKLACNDVGMGAMASVEQIATTVRDSMRWTFPVQCNGIPINHHPGAFGFHRKKNHHTGVDLYCKKGSPVYAVEDGRVVHIAQFTGKAVGHTWWNDTWGMMVEGASGVVNYGEIDNPETHLWLENHWSIVKKVGDRVKKGELIGHVNQVLFDEKFRPDIEGHSCSMLHFELYKHGTREFADWHEPQKNPNLLDPTQDLMNAIGAPLQILTWDNAEGKTAG